MKKLFAMLLCLLVVLSLAACGEEEKAPAATKGEDSSNVPDVIPQPQQPAAEPSEEEKAQLDRYFEIAQQLEAYMNGSGFYLDLSEDESYHNMTDRTIAFVVKELKAMELVDKYAASEYCSQKNQGAEYQISWNRQDYLSKFKVLKSDVLLQQQTKNTDHVGNVSNNGTVKPWHTIKGEMVLYDEDLLRLEKTDTANGCQNFVPLEIYDEAGKLEKVEYYGSSSDIILVRVPEYDAKGLRVKDTVTNSSGYSVEVFYTYDEQNRQTQIKWEHYQWDFTYDDKGNQVKQVWSSVGSNGVSEEVIWEYTFDEKGNATSALETRNGYSMRLATREMYLDDQTKNQHTITYDDQGRILTWETVPGDTYNMNGSNAGKVWQKARLKLITYIFTYGDLTVFENEQN